MSILQRIFGASERRSIDTNADWSDLIVGTTTSAGVYVGPASALRSTVVRSCVTLISGVLATLPLELFEIAASNERRVSKDHPATPLTSRFANGWTPAPKLIEQVTVDALLNGAGFIFINRVGGIPRELIRLTPGMVQVNQDPFTLEPLYKITGQKPRDVNRNDIIHIQAPGSISVKGDSPVNQCREAIGIALTIEGHVGRLFGNGGRPSGVLKFPTKLGADTASRIKTSWQAAHAAENSGNTAVLEEGGEFQPLAFSSTDAQTLELWERSAYEICRIFGVPPSLVFELGRATWGNASAMADAFLRFCLSRWLQIWTSELALKLLETSEQANHYFAFDTDQLLAADLAARADAYQKLIASRVLSPNECRAREDLPPYDGGNSYENPNTTSVTIHGGPTSPSRGNSTGGSDGK
ncbi:MAG: phage portal protein [Proteobacteria bacterium]|nr:phage portal protein [Pseudomonadota bacterium]